MAFWSDTVHENDAPETGYPGGGAHLIFVLKNDILTAPAEFRQAKTFRGFPEPFQIPETR